MEDEPLRRPIEDMLYSSRELLALFRKRYPRLTDDQVIRLAVRWYMRSVVNHGMNPITLEPNLAPAVDDDEE